MDSTTKEKALNLEDLQSGAQVILNAPFGNAGTCSTAAATAAKEVTLGTTFALVTEATILVKFANAITVANATLAVTHTTLAGTTTTEAAKAIYLNGAALEANIIQAGASILLRYNGTQFDIIGGAGSGNEVEIGETTPVGNPKLFVDEDADPAVTLDVYTRQEVDTKIATAPEQNTINSTDFVVLKDADNVNRKISKANIMGVVKDSLAELLLNNDLGTNFSNVPALSANAFGSATLANHASVLFAQVGSTGTVSDNDYIRLKGGVGKYLVFLYNNLNSYAIFSAKVNSDGSSSMGNMYVNSIINNLWISGHSDEYLSVHNIDTKVLEYNVIKVCS